MSRKRSRLIVDDDVPTYSTTNNNHTFLQAQALIIRRRASGQRNQRTSKSKVIVAASNPTPSSDVVLQSSTSAMEPLFEPPDTSPTTYPPIPHTTTTPGPQSTDEAKLPGRNSNIKKLLDWLPFRSQYLDELLRHEGLNSEAIPACMVCGCDSGIYRCRDCFDWTRLCKSCLLQQHSSCPLHRIEVWNDEFFQLVSLSALGLRVHLGHDGEPCPSPASSATKMLIVDTNGFHNVLVHFCRCHHDDSATESCIQLLRAGWYPATPHQPSTAFTFDLLDTFHQLTLQGKTNMYDFFLAIEHKTDNTGLFKLPPRYKQFAVVIREWRLLQMLKRAGRGHDPAGIESTAPGALAVECPACPRPGYNMPDCKDLTEDDRYAAEMMLAVDANFRLKLKDRKIKDIELAPGWAYFVEEERYQKLLRSHQSQPEPSSCNSQFSALTKANTLKTTGYKVSGVGAVVCGRHSFVRKLGVADLQKGEKYVMMDYIVLSTLAAYGVLLWLRLSYDIACQWEKRFPARVLQFPEDLRLDFSKMTLRAAMPKFHLPAHGDSCQSKYSLNYMPGVGRSYGEGVESEWAHINSVAMSTREMGSGSRHETLNDHWGHWNWRKVVGFGDYFEKCLRDAVMWQAKTTRTFHNQDATFPTSTTETWAKMVKAWEDDHRQPDPYAEPIYTTTSKDIRLQLANEDAIAAAKGQLHPHDMSPAAFLQVGLELEDLQRTLRLRILAAKSQMTVYDRKDILDRRTALTRRITAWRVVQDVYMPRAVAMRKVPTFSSGIEDDADDDVDAEPDSVDDVHNAEDLDLILPSSLPVSHRSGDYVDRIMSIETRLRLAQADDALGDLRRLRRAKQGVLDFKILNTSGAGNKPNTRVREVFNQLEARIQRVAARYNAAYQALTVLDPDGSWVARLRFLKAEDIRGPGREEDEFSEGRREVSWIWLAPTEVVAQPSDESAESVECFTASMRVEWAKSRARAKRWEEEVGFIQVEMQRVLTTFEKDASVWLDRRRLRNGDKALMNGLSAYAAKQAAIKIGLANQFALQWLPGLRAFNLDPSWAAKYENNLHLSTLPSFVSPLFSFNELSVEDSARNSTHDMHVPELARSLGPTPTIDERIDMFDDFE